jgi:hypothetical protein
MWVILFRIAQHRSLPNFMHEWCTASAVTCSGLQERIHKLILGYGQNLAVYMYSLCSSLAGTYTFLRYTFCSGTMAAFVPMAGFVDQPPMPPLRQLAKTLSNQNAILERVAKLEAAVARAEARAEAAVAGTRQELRQLLRAPGRHGETAVRPIIIIRLCFGMKNWRDSFHDFREFRYSGIIGTSMIRIFPHTRNPWLRWHTM